MIGAGRRRTGCRRRGWPLCLVGRLRDLTGLQPVSALLEAGIAAVQTLDGQPVMTGLVQTDKLRPARRNGRPIAVVEWDGDCWQPLKLD